MKQANKQNEQFLQYLPCGIQYFTRSSLLIFATAALNPVALVKSAGFLCDQHDIGRDSVCDLNAFHLVGNYRLFRISE